MKHLQKVIYVNTVQSSYLIDIFDLKVTLLRKICYSLTFNGDNLEKRSVQPGTLQDLVTCIGSNLFCASCLVPHTSQ